MLKSMAPIVAHLASRDARHNLRLLGRLLVVFVVLVSLFSVAFHWIMAREDRAFSWPSSVYWTVVTMSTLGFGDITFESDLGRMFSIVVLLTGSVFILVLLPFTFIQFVYLPVMEARRSARAPRRLPDDLEGHMVLTDHGPLEDELIRHAEHARVPYAVIVSDIDRALALRDRGYEVMVGDLDDPETYRAAGVERAALVATTRADTSNTNIAFTAREISAKAKIVATASSSASVDILELAGCDRVLQLGELLGRALAARVAGDGHSLVVGGFGELLVAEAVPAGTPLEGRRLGDLDLRNRVGVNVVGTWQRGRFALADPATTIEGSSVLVLAGTRGQLQAFDEAFAGTPSDAPVVIIGGGRVGRAAGRALAERGRSYRVVEQRPERVRDPEVYVQGDAADRAVLERAGIGSAPAIVVTTHDDDVNVYLTLYCRRLRPEAQVLARANLDRNVTTLHRAGADVVLSYASIGATAIWNTLRDDDTLLLADGLEVFRVRVPARMAGRSLADCAVRPTTGCNVIAVTGADDAFEANPDPHQPLPADAELVVIGDDEAERRFRTRYPG